MAAAEPSSAAAVVSRLCAKYTFPSWIEEALLRDLEDRIETGSADRKAKEVAKFEAEIANLVRALHARIRLFSSDHALFLMS